VEDRNLVVPVNKKTHVSFLTETARKSRREAPRMRGLPICLTANLQTDHTDSIRIIINSYTYIPFINLRYLSVARPFALIDLTAYPVFAMFFCSEDHRESDRVFRGAPMRPQLSSDRFRFVEQATTRYGV
jgi:hypothetical protein